MATLYVASGRTLTHRGHLTLISGQPVDDETQDIIGTENIQRLIKAGVLTKTQDVLSDEESRRLHAAPGGWV